MLTIEPRVVNKFYAHSPNSLNHMPFWCPFLERAPNHPPLKYRCPVKVSDLIRPAYLNSHLTHNRIESSGCLLCLCPRNSWSCEFAESKQSLWSVLDLLEKPCVCLRSLSFGTILLTATGNLSWTYSIQQFCAL